MKNNTTKTTLHLHAYILTTFKIQSFIFVVMCIGVTNVIEINIKTAQTKKKVTCTYIHVC